MFLKRGKELFLGSFVMVETEFILEDPFKLLLSLNEEVIITSNIFLFKRVDLCFPGREFFLILSDLDFECTEFFESVLKGFGEGLIGLEDFSALLSSAISSLLFNVLGETRMVVSDLQLVLFHHLQLIGQLPHRLSEVLLVYNPVAVHFLKRSSGDGLLGSSSFKFYLGVRFAGKDGDQSLIGVFNLGSDDLDLVVPVNLSLL